MQVFPDRCNLYNVKTKLHATLVYLFDFYLFVGSAEIASFQAYTVYEQSLPKNAYLAHYTPVILRCQVTERADVSKISIYGYHPSFDEYDRVSDL